jgi:predicted amidophosphoribosyltransferase
MHTLYYLPMVYIFSYLCNILFPPSVSAAQLVKENFISFLRFFSTHHFQTTIALSHYSQPLIQAAITANKFHRDNHASDLLAGLLTHWCDTLPSTSYIVVPIPLSVARLRERGHNQVTRVALDSYRSLRH